MTHPSMFLLQVLLTGPRESPPRGGGEGQRGGRETIGDWMETCSGDRTDPGACGRRGWIE